MDGLVNTHQVPASEEPEITSAAMFGPALEEPTDSAGITGQSFEHESDSTCQWTIPYYQQVNNLKNNWKAALKWTGAQIDFENNFETNPWFASAVLRLRNHPCLDNGEVEIDQSLLGPLALESRMTYLNLAILMEDTKLVEEILKKCPALNHVIHRPLVDPQRATDFLNVISHEPTKTDFLFTPLHLAVVVHLASQKGIGSIVLVLLKKGADINAPNWLLETPLELAVEIKVGNLADILLKYGTKEEDPALPHGTINVVKYKKKTPLHHLATKQHRRLDVPGFVKYVGGSEHININTLDESGLSAFYVAVLYCNTEFVIALLEHFKDRIRLNEECVKEYGPPIQIAFEGGDDFKDIERALMECDPVKGYMDKLYRDRQVYVDAANAILVGAALIASVTFASWLQPPLNYTSYFGEGYSSSIPTPATSDFNYVDVEHNIPLRAFWVFNALSFYFAIGSVVCGARSVLPRSHLFIKKTVEKLRINLLVTSVLLACSMLFVIIAFAIAGTIVLTPLLKYQWYMIVPTLVGGVVCIISLVFLVKSMKQIFLDSVHEKSEQFNSKRIDYLRNSGYILQGLPSQHRKL